MRRYILPAVVTPVACFLSLSAFAQSQPGSIGGMIGNTDKSISGSREPNRPESRQQKPDERRSGRAPVQSPETGCQKAVGTWKHEKGGNWTFRAGGSVQLEDGSGGNWRCEGGIVKLTWTRGHPLFVGTTDRVVVGQDGTHMSTTNYLGFTFSLERVR